MDYIIEIKKVASNPPVIGILCAILLALPWLPFYLIKKNKAEKDVPIAEVEYNYTEYTSIDVRPERVYYNINLKTNKFDLNDVVVEIKAYSYGQEVFYFNSTLKDTNGFSKNSTFSFLVNVRANVSGPVDSFYWNAKDYEYRATVISSNVRYWFGEYSRISYQ